MHDVGSKNSMINLIINQHKKRTQKSTHFNKIQTIIILQIEVKIPEEENMKLQIERW